MRSREKRQPYRGIAKCMYDHIRGTGGGDRPKICNGKVIRVVLSGSEYAKKRKPGSMFYALDAIKRFVYDWETKPKKVTKQNLDFREGDEPMPGMLCHKSTISGKIKTSCYGFTKSFNKKLEKFKKDPSNEKVLGRSVVKYIKNVILHS